MKKEYTYDSSKQACRAGGKVIRGVLFRPEHQGKTPLVICSHGFNSSHERLLRYGDALARNGLATFMLDFCGGSDASISDGETTDMSVMTEVQDLLAVLEEAHSWDFVDLDRIVLLGTSQGGLASAIAAARTAPKIAALVLIYPAFMLVDDVHREFRSLEDIPDTLMYRGMMLVGKRYFTDIWDYDPFSEAGRYPGPVLIVHGTADAVVPPEYSLKAALMYENAELELIEGGQHAFEGEAMSEAIEDVVAFLRRIGLIQR